MIQHNVVVLPVKDHGSKFSSWGIPLKHHWSTKQDLVTMMGYWYPTNWIGRVHHWDPMKQWNPSMLGNVVALSWRFPITFPDICQSNDDTCRHFFFQVCWALVGDAFSTAGIPPSEGPIYNLELLADMYLIMIIHDTTCWSTPHIIHAYARVFVCIPLYLLYNDLYL